jgi:hypothetical protein
VPSLPSIFDSCIAFDPACDAEAFLRQVPGRWAVYLFADAEDNPIQILCVKNLRASLKRRLFGLEPIMPSRKVNYREVVRRIHWVRVDSAFEADWVYLQAARTLYPESYRGMVGFRPAWFIHVDPDAAFPRYTRTTDLSTAAGLLIGPVEDKHAAARLVQLAEDAFDLCRYYNILLAAPHGKACAYKEMGKCPAPCDGSIGMDEYRRMVRQSAAAVVDPAGFIERQIALMQQAAADLKFELAGRLKAKLAQAGQFGAGPFRHARLLADFQYLAVARGPSQGDAKLFLVTPAGVEPLVGLIREPADAADLLRQATDLAAKPGSAPVSSQGAEDLAVVAHHLFLRERAGAALLPMKDVGESALRKAYLDLKKQKPAEESEDEGIVRELQTLGMADAPKPPAEG